MAINNITVFWVFSLRPGKDTDLVSVTAEIINFFMRFFFSVFLTGRWNFSSARCGCAALPVWRSCYITPAKHFYIDSKVFCSIVLPGNCVSGFACPAGMWLSLPSEPKNYGEGKWFSCYQEEISWAGIFFSPRLKSPGVKDLLESCPL